MQAPQTPAVCSKRANSTCSPSSAICGTIKNLVVNLLFLYFTDLHNEVDHDEFFLLSISVVYWVCKDRHWTDELLASIVHEVWKQLSDSAVPVMDDFHQQYVEMHCNAAALSLERFLKAEDPEHRAVKIEHVVAPGKANWLLLYRSSLIKLFNALPNDPKKDLASDTGPYIRPSPYKVCT